MTRNCRKLTSPPNPWVSASAIANTARNNSAERIGPTIVSSTTRHKRTTPKL
ncbi:MAG: hypothetical protein U5L06_11545 [Rhodovibrio sp.]|nr:hypothetical protein [Rhodovibrio sp.]